MSNNEITQNLQLAKELHKTFIRNLKKIAVYSRFKDNIEGADLANVKLKCKFNKGFRFLLCVINVLSKYPCVVPLEDKIGVRIVDAFHKMLDKLGRKPSKKWVDTGSEFYNNLFKKW